MIIEVLAAFTVGFSLAVAIFGSAWHREKSKREAAESVINALKMDLGRVFGWR